MPRFGKHPAHTWAFLLTAGWAMAACSGKPASATADPETLRPSDPRLAQLYEQSCLACHAVTGGLVPPTGNVEAWRPRLDKGLNVLVRHARQGFNGMPAGGLCLDCSDADFEQLILFMSSDLSGTLPR